LGVPVELADPVDALEVGEHEDMEQLGAGSWSALAEEEGPYVGVGPSPPDVSSPLGLAAAAPVG
jgi:hypothetical protein